MNHHIDHVILISGCTEQLFNYAKNYPFGKRFFDNNNVRIHLDTIESGLEIIIKQIALLSIGGLSIGKMRSYPTINKGEFIGYFPNDVYFSLGQEDAKKINITNDHIENILVSGFPFAATKNHPDNEPVLIEKKLKSNNTKFNILLLDSNHSNNDGLDQLIEKSTMILVLSGIPGLGS